MKKVVLSVLVVAIVAVIVLVMFNRGDSSKQTAANGVKVEKGEIIEKAMAIGTIQPYKEVLVKGSRRWG